MMWFPQTDGSISDSYQIHTAAIHQKPDYVSGVMQALQAGLRPEHVTKLTN